MINCIKIIFAFLFLSNGLFISFTYAQKNQVYKGNYVDEISEIKGISNYQYYENSEGERIYNGLFIFKSGVKVISGNYKNNLKDGIWTAKRSYSTTNTLNGYLFENSKESIVASFKNGKLNGKTSEIRTSLKTKRIIQQSSANFIDNRLVGKFKYFLHLEDLSINIEFTTDSFGLYNGDVKEVVAKDGIKFEFLRKYKHGILYWCIHKNLSNGKIDYKFENGFHYKLLNNKYEVLTNVKGDIFWNENSTGDYNSWEIVKAYSYWYCSSQSIGCATCGCSYNLLFSLTHGMNFDGFMNIRIKESSTD